MRAGMRNRLYTGREHDSEESLEFFALVGKNVTRRAAGGESSRHSERNRTTVDHQWHYVRDGRSLGPISTSELRQLVARGELGSDDLVWREGMAEWSSVAAMSFTPPSAAPPPVPARRPATSQHTQRARQSLAPANPRVVVWSVIAVVAVLLCVGWVIVTRPVAPTKRERASNPSNHPAKTNDVSEPAKKQREAAPVSPPPNDSARTVPVPDSVDTTPDVILPSEQPKELGKPAIESQKLDVTASAPKQPAPTTVQQPAATPAQQTLYQVVEIRRIPTFSIQGLETKQSLHYQVLSQLDLERNAESRTTKVIQLVEDTRLVAADDSSRDSFAKALESLKGHQYTYRLNDRGEVIEFTGHKDTRATIPLDLASGTGFQLTSVIDEDGWKELAELTFVVPPDGQRAGAPWQRQMTHDWGALGNWSGLTTFASQPPRDELLQIAFTREMKYTAPRADVSGLPFQIRNAAFELQQAAGTIVFDVTAQRVRNATENFDVRGTVSVELAGVGVQIDLTEQQRIEISVSTNRPAFQ